MPELAEILGSDHPHACGENSAIRGASQRSAGPSPRVWGEPDQGCNASKALRTIPTRVGRTSSVHT